MRNSKGLPNYRSKSIHRQSNYCLFCFSNQQPTAHRYVDVGIQTDATVRANPPSTQSARPRGGTQVPNLDLLQKLTQMCEQVTNVRAKRMVECAERDHHLWTQQLEHVVRQHLTQYRREQSRKVHEANEKYRQTSETIISRMRQERKELMTK